MLIKKISSIVEKYILGKEDKELIAYNRLMNALRKEASHFSGKEISEEDILRCPWSKEVNNDYKQEDEHEQMG